MKILRTIRNYICYCGIEKEEFRVVKIDAYVSNFKIWRILNFFMVAVFGMSEVGDVSITYHDTYEYDQVIASAEFTAKELFDQTKAFVNGEIDKAAIIERYVLMDDVTKQFLDDLENGDGN